MAKKKETGIVWEVISDGVEIPSRSTKLAAGYDLRANIMGPWELQPGQVVLVPTGLTIKLPEGKECQIRSRSGLALKKKIFCLNSPGTVDADYYGNDIGVILANFSKESFIIEPGDRIAQAVIASYDLADNDIDPDQERESGFGHTGVK